MTTRLFAALSLVLLLTLPVLAHHPFSAEYDWKKPVTVTGTVTKVDWSNPHAHIFIDAKDSSGKTQNWDFELGALNALTNVGWSKTTIKNGDTITIDGWQARSKLTGANAKSVKLANGRELSAASSIVDKNANDTKKEGSSN
jgi:hypothetical protein